MSKKVLYEQVTENGETGLRLYLHPGQRRAWDSTRRIVAIVAGSQSGKTSFLPIWLHREIYRCGPGDYAFISPTFTLMELKALPEFRRLFETTLGLGSYVGSPVRRFTLSKKGEADLFGEEQSTPTQVFFGYAENPDSLESATYKAVVLDEAGQKGFKRGSWEAILRRLSIHQGRVLIGTTPYSDAGWLRTEIFDEFRKGNKDVDLIQFPSIANPTFPRAEYDRAAATLPAWKFNLFYRGVLDRPAGMIFDCWDDKLHVWPQFAPPADWPRYGGIDFGGVHTAGVFVCAELDAGSVPTGRHFVYREYGPCGGKTSREHAEDLKRGEPRLPLFVGGAGSEDQWRQEFAAAGLPILEPPIRDVEVGIIRVYAAIKTGKLLVMSGCAKLIDEFGSYSRELDEAGNPTERIDCKEQYHLLDATRYLCAHLFPEAGTGTWEFKPRPSQRNPFAHAPPGVFLDSPAPRRSEGADDRY